MAIDWQAAKAKFRQVWGYEDFRPPQQEIIANLLEHRDSLVILATGSGKSICFQLPAIMRTGLTIVISPLLALMENQVQELQQKNLPAATIHSNQSRTQQLQILRHLSELRLLYISPESLLKKSVWERLCQPQLLIRGLMLDEAHCLAQWGDTFRPAYYRLGAVRSSLMQSKFASHPRMAIAAFTATADPQAQALIQTSLRLENPQIVRTSPYRSNLSLNVAIAWTPAGRKDRTLKFLRSHQQETGLIYMRTRRDTEELAEWLCSEGFATIAYHAGLPPLERREIEQFWLIGKYRFVICTSAFGLGVNNPNTRWVLHFHPPLTLAEYIQEVGRAGRDGNAATALLLVSEPTGILDHTDKQRQEFFVQQQERLVKNARQLLPKLPRYGHIDTVTQMYPDASIALGILHGAGKLVWRTPFEYEISSPDLVLPSTNQDAIAQMQAYITDSGCRWAFLMAAFGFEAEAKSLKCGICDRCKSFNS